MPIPKKPAGDDPAQSQRFIEAAKAEGIEEVGEAFGRALGRVAPLAKAAPKPGARKPKRAKRA